MSFTICLYACRGGICVLGCCEDQHQTHSSPRLFQAGVQQRNQLLKTVSKSHAHPLPAIHWLEGDRAYLSQVLCIWQDLVTHAGRWATALGHIGGTNKVEASFVRGVHALFKRRAAKHYHPVMAPAMVLDPVNFRSMGGTAKPLPPVDHLSEEQFEHLVPEVARLAGASYQATLRELDSFQNTPWSPAMVRQANSILRTSRTVTEPGQPTVTYIADMDNRRAFWSVTAAEQVPLPLPIPHSSAIVNLQFPILAKAAVRLLSVHVSTAAAERNTHDKQGPVAIGPTIAHWKEESYDPAEASEDNAQLKDSKKTRPCVAPPLPAQPCPTPSQPCPTPCQPCVAPPLPAQPCPTPSQTCPTPASPAPPPASLVLPLPSLPSPAPPPPSLAPPPASPAPPHPSLARPSPPLPAQPCPTPSQPCVAPPLPCPALPHPLPALPHPLPALPHPIQALPHPLPALRCPSLPCPALPVGVWQCSLQVAAGCRFAAVHVQQQQAAVHVLQCMAAAAAGCINWSVWTSIYRNGLRSKLSVEQAEKLVYLKANSRDETDTLALPKDVRINIFA
ncbi:hypothetical protein QJQ45_020550 [Haematococcus lacustris]|nr:hypothetical protein QJQ45_020550 [Haematococcus lacustris]